MSFDDQKVKILVVDDLPEKRLVMHTILAELGSGVETIMASSGEEALQRVLEHEFAVILLDVNMPGMDGLETAGYIRRRKKSAVTPIMFVTAFADEILASQGYSLGAVDYILSPVVPDILRTKVGVFVELFRKTQQVKQQADERVMLAREQAARAAAEDATRRSNFLAEASQALAGSLELEATMRALACVAVPFLADVSAVTPIDAAGKWGATEFVWAEHGTGPQRFRRCSPAEISRHLAVLFEKAAATQQTIEVSELGHWPASFVDQSQHPQSSAQSGRLHELSSGWPLRSVIVSPLAAGGKLVGLVTFAVGAAGRKYAPADQALIEDLMARTAIALDNARLYQDVREADRRKDDFLAMLAHELRNPLAPIRSAVQIFQVVGLADATLVHAREMIDRQVAHMVRLIDDLLDVSRLSRGKIMLRIEAVDLAQVVRTAAEDFRGLIEQSGLTLDVQVPDEALYVNGDPARLAQVLANVLQNANKFSDRGGRVEVHVTRDPSSHAAAIVVRDTGIGMEPQTIACAFEVFSQADRSLDRSRGGLGLGLALVKGLVDLHGGQVQAASDGLGHGTQITIRLPLAAAPRPAPAPVNAAAPGVCSHRILVIEDNRDAADSLRMLLRLIGHEVEVAYDGAAGVELAREFQPDAVLCDIGLPGEFDGYRVASAIRQDPILCSAFLVAATGYGRPEDRRRSHHAGFDAHLTKPVSLADLQRVMSDMPVKV